MSDLVSGEVSRVQELIYELQVKDVMQRDVISISPQTSMREFKELLRLKRISGTPVVQDGQLVGILSLEDAARINPKRCIGCGLCVGACEFNAISLFEKDETGKWVPPENIVETYINIARERGKI